MTFAPQMKAAIVVIYYVVATVCNYSFYREGNGPLLESQTTEQLANSNRTSICLEPVVADEMTIVVVAAAVSVIPSDDGKQQWIAEDSVERTAAAEERAAVDTFSFLLLFLVDEVSFFFLK